MNSINHTSANDNFKANFSNEILEMKNTLFHPNISLSRIRKHSRFTNKYIHRRGNTQASVITTIKTFKTIILARTKGMIKIDLFGRL